MKFFSRQHMKVRLAKTCRTAFECSASRVSEINCVSSCKHPFVGWCYCRDSAGITGINRYVMFVVYSIYVLYII